MQQSGCLKSGRQSKEDTFHSSQFICYVSTVSLYLYLSSPLPISVYCPDRKLKKLVRAIKDKGSAEKKMEEERPPQQWNLDYALAPFEGLTPEYMEMSEFHTQYA